jgi:protein-tyrosine phosphatase
VSDNPEQFSSSNPSIQVNASQNSATYVTSEETSDEISRKYFKLVFNNQQSIVVGTRVLGFDRIHNMRDLGGYYSTEGKMSHWGKVYRSGDIYNITEKDSLHLANLGIKTIIDLRDKNEIAERPIAYKNATIVEVSVPVKDRDSVLNRIQRGRMLRRDALLYMQDSYLRYITDCEDQFSQAFHLFTQKENYPILFVSTYGKDRAGILAALLLAALEIPEETILRDYLLSADYVDIKRAEPFAQNLSSDAQETLSLMLSVSEPLIEPALTYIKRNYISIDQFFSQHFNLTNKDIKQIKDILYY